LHVDQEGARKHKRKEEEKNSKIVKEEGLAMGGVLEERVAQDQTHNCCSFLEGRN